MPSYYSVVRLVPSALAEEFVNVGLLTFGDGRVRGKFLEDWSRVERFAADLVNPARSFQEWVLESMVPEGPSDKRVRAIDEDAVWRISKEWAGSVQLSAPRASLEDPDELLEDLAPTFLIEPPPRATRADDKRHLRKHTADSLRRVIEEVATKKKVHLGVQTRRPVSGLVRPRLFDILVVNAAPRHAVQCFNFDVADTKKLLEQVDATAFAIEDVRRKTKDFPISVVATPPQQEEALAFEQAAQTFKEVNARFLVENDVDAWSEDVVGRIAAGGA